MSQWVFLNNDFVPQEKAALHFRDLSIQRGYGIFDFFKVVNFIPVFWEDHLNRFYASANEMRLPVAYSKMELKKIISDLLERNAIADTGVRITLTGGYSTDGYQLTNPNLIIALHSFSAPTTDEITRGIKLVSYSHQRQLPHVKTIDYLMAIWLQPFIKQNHANDVLYHQNGIVTECPRSNFFAVTKDDRIITPSKNILRGVMRSKLVEAAKANFKVEERDLTINEIKNCKEAFITSTTKLLLPVQQMDDYIFPCANSISSQLYQLLLEMQHTETAGFDQKTLQKAKNA